LLNLYEPDATMIPQAGQMARGKGQIREALEFFLATRGTIGIETTAAVETADGIGLTCSKWTINGTGFDGQAFEMTGLATAVLRRQPDGRWLYVIESPFAA
jgi:uncharacterized protein (TIGR02246 family)